MDEVVDDEVDDGKGLRTVMTTTKSPTMPDAHHWAFGEFFYSLCFFFLINKCFIVYTVYILHNTRQDGDKDEKEPKRRKTRVVWAIHEFSFLFLHVFFFFTNKFFYCIYRL